MGNRTMMCLLALALVLPACAIGGGDGIPSAVYNLAGEWGGSYEDASDDYDLTLRMDHRGHITEVLFDGLPESYTGRISQQTPEGFGIVFSDGTSAVFIVDEAFRHAVYFDPYGGFAVLQKNPTSFPPYLFDDPAGDWSGFAYIYNPGAGGFLKYSPWDMTIADGGSVLPFAGVDDEGNPFGGDIAGWDGYYGWYWGDINVPLSLDVFGGLSPDRQFFGAYIGDIGVDTWPEDFWFLLMTRQ